MCIPCCMASGRKDYCMGNLHEMGLKDMLSSPKYSAFMWDLSLPRAPICDYCKDGHGRLWR